MNAEVRTYLPPLAAVLIFMLQYCSYSFYHLMPQWRKHHGDTMMLATVVFFHFLAAMIVLSFVLVSVTRPGEIPDTSDWMHFDESKRDVSEKILRQAAETKKTGETRHCKWCGKNKPDRCHHCRRCKKCVLKMDHHCPYVLNCVGFRNYKYFIVLIVYSAAASVFMAFTMYPTMRAEYRSQSHLSVRAFAVIYSWAMSVLLVCAITPFVVFHTFLISTNTTTIEYCELATKYRTTRGIDYDIGWIANIVSSLGPWYCWCLPASVVEGDGLSFPQNETQALLTHEQKRTVSDGSRSACGTSKSTLL